MLAVEKQLAVGSNYRATSESQILALAPGENFQQPGRRQMSKRVRNNIPQRITSLRPRDDLMGQLGGSNGGTAEKRLWELLGKTHMRRSA